jgi:arylsulfatase A-like enzyme
MRRSHEQGKPFYLHLPYTQMHIPPIPDPQYVGRTKHGNWADILTQMDDFTGQVLDELDTLGVAGDTIVVWASDNGPDSTWRMPAGDPDPFGGLWTGFGARGGARCSPRWRARTGRRASSAGRARCPRAGSATSWCTRSKAVSCGW